MNKDGEQTQLMECNLTFVRTAIHDQSPLIDLVILLLICAINSSFCNMSERTLKGTDVKEPTNFYTSQ